MNSAALTAAMADRLIATVILSLRFAPTLGFAPPFTLLRTPPLVRLLFAAAIAGWLIASHPNAVPHLSGAPLLSAAALELLLGVSLSLGLQLAFAAIALAGRTLDFQAGFGLSVLADPTLRTQMPLVGALFAYGAGAVFFVTNGPDDLLAIWANSLDRVPIGAMSLANGYAGLLDYIGSVFVIAAALAGFVSTVLFVLDLAIAFMSRTLPQMNVLVLGFQVKTLALLVTLPFVFGASGALFLRIVRLALENTGRLS